MHRNWLFTGLLVAVVISLTACSPAATPIEMAEDSSSGDESEMIRPISLGVGFIPNVQFAPLYVGIENGFFADEGLDVSLDYGFENDYLKLVGTGDSDFMIGSGDQVVIGRAQGLPVRYVMNWYTRYPVVLMAKEAAGITEPADMAGKRIGLPGPYGANYVAFRGLLEAAGLTESDVQMESIGFTQAAAISADTVDAAVDYAANGPVVLAQAGVPVTQLSLDPYLIIPSNGIITNDTLIAEEPELVAKMARATAKSITYTLANPDEAFEISLQFVPEAGGENQDANRAIFDASIPFWTPAAGTTIGLSSLEDWQTAAEFIQRIGLVDTLVPAEELFTNEFVELAAE